jgi:hypothetical protein
MITRAHTCFLLALVPALLAASPAFAQGLSVDVGGVGVSVGSGSSDGATGGASVGASVGVGGVGVGVTADLPGPAGASAAPTETVIGQEAASQAVQDRKALPLAEVISRSKQYAQGDVLDARLISYRGFLLYELKILAAKGDISNLYFYAQSGKIVGSK